MTGSGVSSREHAVLSPSAAERWISCPASIRVGSTLPAQAETAYAMEGTCAHELGEIEARLAFGMITAAEHTRLRNTWRKDWEVDEDTEEEMSVHVAAYVAFIQERAAAYPDTQVLLEQRLHTGVPSCWGTGDCVLVSPVHVEAVDLKYGAGVRVDAEGNPQVRLYGVGALEGIADLLGDVDTVIVTIFQPRIGGGHVSSETLTADELRAWRDSIIPVAEEALGEHAHFGPSEEACRWCPAAGQCRAQLEWATANDFATDPDVLSPAELADALDQIPAIQQWIEAVQTITLDMAYSKGVPLPGYKVVRSGGKRSIPDQQGAIDFLVEQGHSLEEVSKRSLRGIGELEALLGKDGFAETLHDYIKPPVGRPALVPEDDNRPAINPNTEAMKEFE